MMYFISVVIIIVTTLMFVLFASGETDTNNIVFLKGYGWEVSTHCLITGSSSYSSLAQ